MAIARDALNQVRQFCSEFGLTPSSRARMQVPGQKDPGKDALSLMLDEANATARKVLPA